MVMENGGSKITLGARWTGHSYVPTEVPNKEPWTGTIYNNNQLMLLGEI